MRHFKSHKLKKKRKTTKTHTSGVDLVSEREREEAAYGGGDGGKRPRV